MNGHDGPWLNLFPVWADARRFGIIELISGQPLLPVQLRLVDGLLKIHRNQISLPDYSKRDGLTGQLNRKTFDERFLKCLGMVAGNGHATECSPSWWQGVIDVDHFKRVNDNFGHPIGEEELLVARIPRTAFHHSE